ncbi:LOW QUALITY PROTEIN: hypothetical protein OSB04_002548 [Centaurea solstitialis]|uniref:Integrase catalytic domain-containing protein n=1 Tax=Centaurea solstitialis TaxID=347529 RepID=A0AA38WMG3_9ASTR|nr:LOW QUALITY PROTEIN: hypothetical protein OSB04_002548 [Centaurea solstitialis]
MAAVEAPWEENGSSMNADESLKNCKNGLSIGGIVNVARKGDIIREKSWILDCGATDTMTHDLSDFATTTKPIKAYIQTANGEKTNVRTGGTIEISPTLKLSHCLYVTALLHKLLSVSHVTKELNCSVLMQPPFDIRTGAIIGRGTERQGLYYVDEVTLNGTVMLSHGTMEREAWLWHRRLGHPSTGYLHTHCETCVLAKSHRKTFKPNNTRVDSPFLLTHSDVWGPTPVLGGQNYRYFVTFIDDCTRMTWVYLLKNKSEVVNRFTAFYAMILTQFQKQIQVFRYNSPNLLPHTPEQNGFAEQKNRIILEITRALLTESRVPKFLWPEALVTAVYLINRLPTRTLKSKLDPCAEKCVFVGYGVNQKGYRCYNPKSGHMFTTMNCDFLETEYYYTSHHSGEKEYDTLSWLRTTSYEKENNHSPQNEDSHISAPQEIAPNLIFEVSNTHSSPVEPTNNVSGQSENIQDHEECLVREGEEEQEIIEEPPTQEDVSEKYVLPPRGNRGVPPKRYPTANIVRGNLASQAKAFVSSLYSEEIPTNTEQALRSRHWKDAMEEEMKALTKNNTWEKCLSGCRWVFTIKYKPDGTIERHKARLVAKGYTQTYGIDYSETFSPVAKINTNRVLCSIAANKGWPLRQFDVKNAFLHRELHEEVYMEAPHGFTDRFKEGEVCLLKRSLYGLKQSPRAWFGGFTLAMRNYGFKQSDSDHTLFLKQMGDLITYLIIYVDDMIITGDHQEEITKLKRSLFTEFEMKDLGNLKYFLGIEVLRSKRGIFMCQRKNRYGGLQTGRDPDDGESEILDEEKSNLADKGRYQRMVGKLIYLSHTRPDIAYAVGAVSQFTHQPQEVHMEAVLRIIPYLKGMVGHGILFKPNGNLETQLYTDADWGETKTSEDPPQVGGNLVTWRRKKQKVVALSSVEAEFRGIARGITEVLWIRKLLTEIGYPPQEPSKVLTDNEAAIQISENPVQHDRTKHIEVDRHFIKEKLEANIITLPFVRSEDQLADILTKAVNKRSLHECLSKLNFGDPTIQLEGEC